MALGDALQENKVLRTLNVANNSIDSVACLTICAGVLENEVCHVISFHISYIISCHVKSYASVALVPCFVTRLLHAYCCVLLFSVVA
jgi:hypothetical protein